MQAEPVGEPVFIDRLAVAVDLAGDIERTVAGEADLQDDGDQDQPGPPLVNSLLVILLVD